MSTEATQHRIHTRLALHNTHHRPSHHLLPISCSRIITQRLFHRRLSHLRQAIPRSPLIPPLMIIRIPLSLMLPPIMLILTLNPHPKPPRPKLHSLPTQLLPVPPPQLPINPISQPIRRLPLPRIPRIPHERKPEHYAANTKAAREQRPAIPVVAHGVGFS